MELETRKNARERKDDQEVYFLIKNNIEDRYILPEVWQAKEIMYDVHIKHSTHLNVEPNYNEILRTGHRWDSMLIIIRDLYL